MFLISKQKAKVKWWNILKRSLESWKAGVGENRTPVLERVVGMKSCVLHLQQEEMCMVQFKSWSTLDHFRVRCKYLRCTPISFRKLCSLKGTQGLFSKVLFWHCFVVLIFIENQGWSETSQELRMLSPSLFIQRSQSNC